MLVVGICDGDTSVRILIANFIKRYKEETGLNIQVLSYDSGEKLLNHYSLSMDLIFLEIPFSKINGIEIAKRIRKIDQNVGIVFLTTILNHVLEAYEVKANNYIIKPLKYQRFLKEIEEARYRSGQNRFFIETNASRIYKIYTKSILFIETEGQNTRIHTETDSILSSKRMKEHEQILFEEYFVRCHAGFIINLLFFEKYEQNDILLSTNVLIPVSRQRRKTVFERIKKLYAQEGGTYEKN